MDIWQLVLAVLVVVLALATLISTLFSKHSERHSQALQNQIVVIQKLDDKWHQENKTLHARHNNLKDRHHAHVKEVSDVYAKKSEITEALDRMEKHINARLGSIDESLGQLLKGESK